MLLHGCLLGIIDGIMKIQLLIIRVEFTGTGKDMLFFFTFLVVTVLTFGIAAFFMMAWLQRKIMSFVHIANNEE